ncbi:hypothetical protein AB1Y20_005849 [Prymnesium parvum]|uniref:D-isomer specific 2-hydroxyacid dehydrogenase NAD-binding domain-containing protein n=1 Tax=Prymnesium parvum TaxID=97485 RepID=A0AB34J0Y3_PRYPA
MPPRGPVLSSCTLIASVRQPLSERVLWTSSTCKRSFTPLRGFCKHISATRRVPTVAVVAPHDSPAIALMPHEQAEFIVADSLDQMRSHPSFGSVEAMLWIPPGPPSLLSELWRGGHVPHCRWVHGFYAGVDAISDFARELAASDVPLTNGRGAFSSSLAEYAMAAALHFNKQIPRCMSNRQQRKWDKFVMHELRGRTLGLVGYGDIAKATAKIARAFGMRVIALRRNASKPDETGLADLILGPYSGPIQPSHKRALFSESDVVVCVLPGTAETRHFVSTAEFEAMKPGSIFISMGRGIAVDEAALVQALRKGTIAGAALDVFEQEPLPTSSPLWECDNLLLTAHNADFTEDYFKLGWNVWSKNLSCYLDDQPLATIVDKRAGY